MPQLMTKEENTVFVICLSIIAILGLLGNIIFAITIFFRGLESKLTNYLLRSQSIIDSVVCIVTIVIVIFPDPVKSDSIIIDNIFCHIWTSQAFFWWIVLCSIYNLILLAVDRYLAVIKPQSYKVDVTKKIYCAYTVIFGFSSIAVIPAFFQTSFKNGTCLAQLDFDGLVPKNVYTGYSVFWFIAVYGFPAPLMIYLYSKIIWRLNQSFKGDKSQNIQVSMKTFTKSTMINTVVFLLTISYDAIYYMLGYLGATEYVLYSPTQRAGVFLTSVNSSTNPIVFFILVKSFRRKFLLVWGTKCMHKFSNKVIDHQINTNTSQ